MYREARSRSSVLDQQNLTFCSWEGTQHLTTLFSVHTEDIWALSKEHEGDWGYHTAKLLPHTHTQVIRHRPLGERQEGSAGPWTRWCFRSLCFKHPEFEGLKTVIIFDLVILLLFSV